MRKYLALLLLPVVLLLSGCSDNGNEEQWKMNVVWHVDTAGESMMDLSPDGQLAVAVDWDGARIYLAKPSGESVSYSLEGMPVVSGVALKDGVAYVLGSYEDFAGVKKYSWNGEVGGEKHGGLGSVSDDILRSPSGNHLCYLVTLDAGKQELYCDGVKMTLKADDYFLNSVSDTGVVVLSKGDNAYVFKEGREILSFNTSNVIAYKDRILVSKEDSLRVYDLNGNLIGEKEGYTFKLTTLLRWTLLPTEKYIFRHEPLEDTYVITWDMKEVGTLPGFPQFANDRFVVTSDDGVLHCYSLKDFHEVFSVEMPEEDGLVKLSEYGKVMLLSGENGDYWLYVASQ